MTRAAIAGKRKAPKIQKRRIVAASAKKAAMKIAHFSLCNGSGMHAVAKSMVESEVTLGLDSILINIETDVNWNQALDADVHVSHTHIPVIYRGKAYQKQLMKPFRLVGYFHGTPNHVYMGSVQAGENGAYGHSNSLMIMMHDLKRSHARVTSWERHAAIYRTMVQPNTPIHVVPLGLDLDFWKAGESRGKYQGNPSVWYGENSHEIKWIFPLLVMWPWICEEVSDAVLHGCYIPQDQHRWVFPFATTNGAYYKAHLGSWTYPHDELRRVLKSVDFVLGLVEKGDFNRLSLEANATGAKTISYAGNPYSDFHLHEGDERNTAKELIAIFNGDIEPRDKTPVPSLDDMGRAMVKVYESIL